MAPDSLKVGQNWPGDVPAQDGAVFELAKYGPDLRLFFSGLTDEMVRCVERDDIWIGVLRYGDLGIVPWKIGEHMRGDAQFHVYLYPPETRPTDQVLTPHDRYPILVTLVDRGTRTIRAVRHVSVSHELGAAFNEIVVHQLGNFLDHEDYDAQISGYQDEFPEVETAIQAAEHFEKAENHTPA